MVDTPPRNLVLTAPLSGRLMAVEQVPDPVFAGKMVGDGIAIDPTTSTLLAPCDGRIIQLHSAGHALTIADASGVEVLIHIGLDTVKLKGHGFTPRVAVGDRVRSGDRLIDFDADYVATHAVSLLTLVIVTTPDRVESMRAASGVVSAGREAVITLTLAGGPGAGVQTGATATSDEVLVSNPSGLHARPAALFASRAKQFESDIRLRRNDRRANAKSVVSIMTLEVDRGDRVTVEAQGPDAQEAVAVLSTLLAGGLGEEGAAPGAGRMSGATPGARAARAVSPPATVPDLLLGVAASPGVAVGHLVQVRHEEIAVAADAEDPRQERRSLDVALEQARAQLEALRARLVREADAGQAAIFAAHEELLSDPDVIERADAAIASGRSAGFAWREAVTLHADRLARLNNELLAARANDLRDVGRRVLRLLAGAEPVRLTAPENSILAAEDLTPSDTAGLDRARVLGFCTTRGGATSHVAILARSLDIPAVAGIDPRVLEVPDGTPVVLDGTQGTLRLSPSPGEVTRIRQAQQRHLARRRAAMDAAHEPAVTRDGHRIEVVGNIGGVKDAEQVIALGGEGVGLLRSEFLFMDRTSAPTEDEQVEAYRAVATVLGRGRPLIIRTLDVGGDKPLAYLHMAEEANPFLGERGIRLLLDRPDVLRSQLRAILRSASAGRVLVMFPMVATLAEWRAAKALLEEEREALGVAAIPAGVMVEVPSAALLANRLAAEVDFFSIGTNDLTQYTLAMDRGHPKLAPSVDGLDPAVLQLIAGTVRAAHARGRWVGVCGGTAGDPQAIPILLGLGVNELSVSVPAIPLVKAQVRALSLETCRELAERALAMESAHEVRTLCGLD
jgi:multiphosphoryl transfer protein